MQNKHEEGCGGSVATGGSVGPPGVLCMHPDGERSCCSTSGQSLPVDPVLSHHSLAPTQSNTGSHSPALCLGQHQPSGSAGRQT